VCQRSSNHKLKAIHNGKATESQRQRGVSKIVKSQIESNSQQWSNSQMRELRCVKDRQITNWKQFTTVQKLLKNRDMVCQRSSNHKLKAIHNMIVIEINQIMGVSKIVKSQIESNSQRGSQVVYIASGCVKDRQITNWKQFTTGGDRWWNYCLVCQRSSNHKLKAIHNCYSEHPLSWIGVSKIVKSQIESNSQLEAPTPMMRAGCVKDRQITNWKQFTTNSNRSANNRGVCQRSSNHKLKAIHNWVCHWIYAGKGVSKIVKSQIESNSQHTTE